MSAKLDGQLAKLQQVIEFEHARYVAAASVAVAGVLAEFGLTIEDIATPELRSAVKKAVKREVTARASTRVEVAATKPPKAKKAAKPAKSKRGSRVKGPQPPKYRDPESGATWSGYARPPSWIAGVKDRTPYLINGAA